MDICKIILLGNIVKIAITDTEEHKAQPPQLPQKLTVFSQKRNFLHVRKLNFRTKCTKFAVIIPQHFPFLGLNKTVFNVCQFQINRHEIAIKCKWRCIFILKVKFYLIPNHFRSHVYTYHTFYTYKWLCECVRKFVLLCEEKYFFWDSFKWKVWLLKME